MERKKLSKEIKFPGSPIQIKDCTIKNEVIITDIVQHSQTDTQVMLLGVLRSEDGDEISYIQPYYPNFNGDKNSNV